MAGRQAREASDKDIGLKVVHDAPTDVAQIELINIVAVHGLGTRPDNSWRKNVGTKESPFQVNLLVEKNSLPTVAPHGRIMRYGYRSQSFGEGAMGQRVVTVTQPLLMALMVQREDDPFRPLIFSLTALAGRDEDGLHTDMTKRVQALLDAWHDSIVATHSISTHPDKTSCTSED